MSNPTVSIVVPVYNVEKYLNRCVDSILNQTYKDFELILVDDGSPDNSGKICDEYAAENSNIRVIHKQNGGVGRARNTGIEQSSGRYITFLDSDDYIEEDYLDVLRCHLNKNPDLIIGGIYFIYHNIQKRVPQKERKTELLDNVGLSKELSKLLKEDRLNYLHAKIYKKEIIDQNNLRFEDFERTAAEDTVFNFEFLLKAKSIILDSRYIHNYVVDYSQNTLSRKFDANKYEKILAINNLLEDYAKKLNAYTKEFADEVDTRRIRSATWHIESIMNSKLSGKNKLIYANKILSNEQLQQALENLKEKFPDGQYEVMRKKNAKYLFKFHNENNYGKGIRGKLRKMFKR